MYKYKSSLLAGLGVAAILGSISIASNMKSANAGDGCCAKKASATAVPVANVTPGAKTTEEGCNKCPYGAAAAKAAAEGKPCPMAKDAAMGASCPMKKSAGQDVQSASARFRAANTKVLAAVDKGASESEVRNLAVKAGEAYADFIRQSAASYKASGKANVSYASWSADVGACSMGVVCPNGEGCKKKDKDDDKDDNSAENVRKVEAGSSMN